MFTTEDIAADVRDLLGTPGETVTFSYQAGAEIDGPTGALVSPGVEQYVEGLGYLGQYLDSEVDGTDIQAGDLKLTVESVSERPQSGWRVTAGGAEYRVMDVRTLRWAYGDVAYVCQVRVR